MNENQLKEIGITFAYSIGFGKYCPCRLFTINKDMNGISFFPSEDGFFGEMKVYLPS